MLPRERRHVCVNGRFVNHAIGQILLQAFSLGRYLLALDIVHGSPFSSALQHHSLHKMQAPK
jgi:hypothetical protein